MRSGTSGQDTTRAWWEQSGGRGQSILGPPNDKEEIRPVLPPLLHALTRFARSRIILISKIDNDKFKVIYKEVHYALAH